MANPLAEFESCIAAVLGQSNELRQQAEAALEQKRADPSTYISSLATLFQGSSNPQVRVLSGVLLRQQIDNKDMCWDQAEAAARAHVSQVLLEMLGAADEIRLVRRTVAEAIGSVAIKVLPQGEWTEFMPSLFQLSASESPGHRVSVAMILEKLIEFAPKIVLDHLDEVKSILYRTLDDQNAEVAASAVSAVVSLLIALTAPQRKQMADCIPLVFKAIHTNVASGDEDRVRDVLMSLIQLVSCDAPFMRPYLQEIVTSISEMAANEDLEDSTRKMSTEFLLSLAEHGQGMIRKAHYFVQLLVPVARKFLLEVDEDSDWHNVVNEMQLEQDNFEMGLQATDRLAAALGGKVFMPVAIPIIEADLQSPNWIQRHAALAMLSEMLMGCAKFMRPKQDEIFASYVLPSMNDPHHRVRWMAVNCMAQMCNDYAPTFQTELHAQILPPMITMCKDPVARVAAHSALCMVDFCAGIEQEDDLAWFEQYTDAALGELLQMLQNQASLKTIESALTAVASIAHICRSAFIKYYDYFMPLVKNILTNATTEDSRSVRGKAIECVGLIGTAVGPEKFSADALEIMHQLMATQEQGLKSDDPQYAPMVQAFARICECVGESFAPFLPYVIPPLLHSAQLEGGRAVPDVGVEDEPEEGIERMVIAVRGSGNMRLELNTAVLEEKALACNMLFQYATRLKATFFPYVEDVLKIVLPLVRYRYNESVRVASVSAVPALLNCAFEYAKQAGADAPANLVRSMFEAAFEPMLECMHIEPDIDQLCNIVRSFTECVELLSEPLNDDQIEVSCAVIKALMAASKNRRLEAEQKLASGEDVDEETLEQLEQQNEYEEDLLGLLIDFTNRMVKNSHDRFSPFFHQHMAEAVSEFLTAPKSSKGEQVTAICIFDDIIEHGGPQALAEYAPPFFPYLLQNMTSPQVEIRQACLYGIGVLGALMPSDQFLPHRDQVLSTLAQIIDAQDSRSEDNYPSTCNAASAFLKIVTSSHNCTGLDMTVIWPRWLRWLPLNGDEDEARLTHLRLMERVQAQDAAVLGENMSNLPELVRIFSAVVFDIAVSDRDLNIRISQFWKALNEQLPAEAIQQLKSALPEIQQAKLDDCLKFADA